MNSKRIWMLENTILHHSIKLLPIAMSANLRTVLGFLSQQLPFYHVQKMEDHVILINFNRAGRWHPTHDQEIGERIE